MIYINYSSCHDHKNENYRVLYEFRKNPLVSVPNCKTASDLESSSKASTTKNSLSSFESMLRTIIFCTISQLLFFTRSVDSLIGNKVVRAYNHEYPFVVSFQYPHGQHFCTGTLITIRHILTATQCLVNENPNTIRVVLGVDDLRNFTYQYRVDSWISFTDWLAARSYFRSTSKELSEISVVILANQIIHGNVQPLRLTTLNKQQVQGKPVRIIGWQDRSELAKGSITVLTDEDCERRIRLITNRAEKINEKLLCTAASSYVLLQKGDSGGALLDKFGGLLGVHVSVGPSSKNSWSNSSEEFLNSYKLNLHSSVSYFRRFIADYARQRLP